jgi:hypothetical protein
MVVSAAFAWLARARRAPAFHPRGIGLRARLVVADPGSGFAAALGGSTTEADALVRLSKGIGTPAGWPDLLGFAVRVLRPDGAPLDLLLTTTGRHRLTDRLLLPARGWTRNPYSTLLPYRTPNGSTVLRVVPDHSGNALGTGRDELVAAVADTPLWFTLQEGRRPVARIALLGEEHGETAFDPVLHADAALRPTILATLRARAYRGSRTGRGAAGLERTPG